MNPFFVVDEFERQVAEFAGSRYAVATDTCTSALFLCMKYVQEKASHFTAMTLPARTFISVPMMAMHLGIGVEFEDKPWKGIYQLKPFPIWDGALRFKAEMYKGGLHCLSFHSRKILNIGRGGMVMTDDQSAYHWLRKARYCGRQAPDYSNDAVDMLGFLCYMHPEQAARGLELMHWIGDGEPDQEVEYSDLRNVKLFREARVSVH